MRTEKESEGEEDRGGVCSVGGKDGRVRRAREECCGESE